MASSFSWERHQTSAAAVAGAGTTSASSNNNHHLSRLDGRKHSRYNIDNDEAYNELIVHGYQCKFYRDDEKTHWINSGKHLISWMGEPKLLIDRYDARGCLYDLSAFDHPQKAILSAKELKLENELDLERYADLKYDGDNDDNNDEGDNNECSNKTTNQSKPYSCIPYQYDQDEQQNKCDNSSPSTTSSLKMLKDSKNDFELPSNLNVPSNILLPKNKKLNCIIEKTALFVSKQGPQMEILLKMKQSSNSNFHFLSHDSELHEYYSFILNEIKCGRYTPQVTSTQSESESDDSDDDYLHPSLLSSKKEDRPVLPSLVLSQNSIESQYSQLVKNFRDKFAEDIVDEEETKNVADISEAQSINEVSSLLPTPPDMVEKIITKLAEYVAKQGQSFEESIKSRKDEKFDFLNKGHIYHPYYVKQKIHFIKEYKKTHQDKPDEKNAINKTITFSIAKVNKKSSIVINKPSTDPETSKDDNDSLSDTTANQKVSETEKKLQQIRKQKLALFLQKLKNTDETIETYGPQLPQQLSNVELSPTTKAITNVNLDDDDDDGDGDGNDSLPLSHSPSIKSNTSPIPKTQRRIISSSPPKLYKHDNSNEDKDVTSKSKRNETKKRKHKHHHEHLSSSSSHKSRRHKSSHKHRHRKASPSYSREEKNRSKHHRYRSRSRSKSRSRSRGRSKNR